MANAGGREMAKKQAMQSKTGYQPVRKRWPGAQWAKRKRHGYRGSCGIGRRSNGVIEGGIMADMK